MINSLKFNSFLSLIASLVLFLSISFNLNSQVIPNGDNDLLWKIENVAEGNGVDAIAIHPINSNILIGKWNNIFEYDVKNGNLLRKITCDSNSNVVGIALSNDGSEIFIDLIFKDGNFTEEIQILDYTTIVKKGKLEPPISLMFYPSTNQEIFGLYKGKFVKYNYQENRIINSVDSEGNVFALTLSQDGTIFAVGTYGSDGFSRVKIYDANTFDLITKLPHTWDSMISALKFSPLNTYISVTFDSYNGLDVINLQNLQKYNWGRNKNSCSFSSDEKIWIPSAGCIKPITTFYQKENNIPIFEINNCGRTIILNDNKLLLWQTYDIFLYSDRWRTVDVNSGDIEKSGIQNIQYSNNSLQISTNNIASIDELIISDTVGKQLIVMKELIVVDNHIEIQLSLPSGFYLLKVKSSGNFLLNSM